MLGSSCSMNNNKGEMSVTMKQIYSENEIFISPLNAYLHIFLKLDELFLLILVDPYFLQSVNSK